MSALFNTSYLPSVEYLKLLSFQDSFQINEEDLWKKKTHRNRCFILSPNGVQCLSVPVSAKHLTTPIKDVKIDYSQQWIRIHKGALEAAYNTAPYFEFIKDDMWYIFEKKPAYLFDLNQLFLSLLIKKFKLKTVLSEAASAEFDDFRKLSDNHATEPIFLKSDNFKNYPQVFNYKHPFSSNLSSIDFLSNMGSFTQGW